VGTTNRNITVSKGDAIDQVERDGLPDWRRSRGYDAAPPRGWAMPWQAWLALIGAPLALGGYLIVRFVAFISELSYQTSWLDVWLIGTLKIALFLSPVAGVAILIYWLYLKAADARVIRLQNNMPIARRFVEQEHWQPAALASLGAFYATEQAWAEHSGLRSLNQLDMSSATLPASKEQSPQLLSIGPAPIPDREWMDWIDRTPHLMIAGRTEAGKTTMAEAVIAQRASQGELLYVLDPHYQPGKWCGLPAVGGGRGYGDVMSGLSLVMEELDQRYVDFSRGKRTEDFKRLTVFIDEVPALVEWCFDGKKLRDPRWISFAKHLGSEARKVRIAVILMTQSPLVQDILINTRMRENFTRIALGDQAGELIKEDSKNRDQLMALIEGQRYTAAMEYLNKTYVLDTSNVPSLAQRSTANARPWQPSPQIHAQPPARPVVSASAAPSATVRASASAGAIIYPPIVKSTNGKIAWLLGQGYSYRQIEKELSVSHQTISRVSVALQAQRKGPHSS
jgi:hypothetical protein